MKTKDFTAGNRAAWNVSARHHGAGSYWEELTKCFADPTYSRFDNTFTQALIAAGIPGAKTVQIGCNNGRETLSACALGASVCWGIDQSDAFLAQANTLREISGHPARFLQADIYDLPDETPRDFDLAFITIGVLNWMPDLPRFFEIVASLLRPGGRLLIYETHPMLEMFDPKAVDPFKLDTSYFRSAPFVETGAITYDGSSPKEDTTSYWFVYTLSDIIQGAVNAGLALEQLKEFPHSIREVEYDIYEDQDAQLPMSFFLQAVKQTVPAPDTAAPK